jgi:hypothetical protein
MTRVRVAVLTAGLAYAVTLACAWLLLPSRVAVALGSSELVVDRYQYVVGAGIGAWALAAGTGGLGLAVDSLTTSSGARSDDLSTWLEAWVLACATVVVWLQVAAGSDAPDWLTWSQLGVVLVGSAGAVLLLAARALAVRRRG